MVGIVSYGFYIPHYRISTEEIAKTWNKNHTEISKSLNIVEKAVAGMDEDSVTMAYAAAVMALQDSGIQKKDIGSVFFGSETFPYAVKPASTIVAEWLDIGNKYLAYDTEFACKAATGALLSTFGIVQSGKNKYGLVCAADKANAKPNDTLEFTAGSGANAWLIGSDNVIAEVVDYTSFSSDTPDFWRRPKADYPSHAGRFTGQPAYFHHIAESAKSLLADNKLQAKDFAYGIFHMPNGRFPLQIGLSLGFTKEQLLPSLVVSELGNSYSASALMGLVAVLEQAKPGDLLFFASYGSGSGSDAIVFRVTPELDKRRREFKEQLKHKTYIDYSTYLKFMGILAV